MNRRPKTILLLSLLGAATPFQAFSTNHIPLITGPSNVPSPTQADSQDSASIGSGSERHATNTNYLTPRRAGGTPSPLASNVLVRKTNGLILQSSAAGRLLVPLAPIHLDVDHDLLSSLRAGAIDATASQQSSRNRQMGKFTAAAALFVAAVELFGRLAGLSSVGETLPVPERLSPLLGRFVTALGLILGPFFTVSFWSATAPIASIMLKLSPMPTIHKVRKRGTTGGLPLLPYSAMCTMTFVLVCYGVLICDTKIMITHGCGHLISLYYCLMFYRNLEDGASNLPGTVGMHAKTGLGIAGAMMVAILALGKGAAPIAGMTSVILSCIMYSGPLTVLKEAIRSKSARNIPLPYSIASLFNALAWLVYGYFGIHDFMIYAPCLIGFGSASAQILVHALFGTGSEICAKKGG